MPVDFLVGATHFLDHVYPIARAIPAAERGAIYLVRGASHAHSVEAMTEHARRCRMKGCEGLEWREARRKLVAQKGPLVVASATDAAMAANLGRPVVYCEHGAGQTYGGSHPSYAGGRGRRGVVLFLCPNEAVAERNREAYPKVRVAIVGCPKLDRWHKAPAKPQQSPPVLAVAFHWDCRVCPETRWAFPYYREGLSSLLSIGPVLGHGHPRIWSRLRHLYPSLGIEPVEDFEDVLERADLYMCDNSSTLFEFASVGRPVVVLNAPWYRRHIEHGLRFWEAATVGVQVDHPAELRDAVMQALEDPPEQQAARQAAVRIAYTYTDGQASKRAAQEILELL